LLLNHRLINQNGATFKNARAGGDALFQSDQMSSWLVAMK
jgi:hypothetical protein